MSKEELEKKLNDRQVEVTGWVKATSVEGYRIMNLLVDDCKVLLNTAEKTVIPKHAITMLH